MPYKDPETRKAYHSRWAKEHPAEFKQYQAEWYQRNRERVLGQQQADRLEALRYYSRAEVPRCRCCGESGYLFLTLDHVENNGREHRISTGGTQICSLLKRQGWPKGYQVLCYNCNFGRAKNGGVCPHQTTAGKRR
jgi:hypothetical protein